MTYLPLARKYRPQTFDALIGQPHVTTTLTRALENRKMAQAYLFAGIRGVGKTSAARILAKCLNCEQGPTATPCQTCASCTQITKGNSLDVLEIDGASNRGIDEIRGLRETVGFAPTTGRFRLYIIDEVHMLTTEAFNALLKTLEEPPAHVKFIFATTAPGKVPPTILSRCQRFDFRRIEAATMVAALATLAKTEQLRVDEPALYAIARASEGSLRDGEVILEQLASFSDGAITEAQVTELLGALGSEALFAFAQAILARDVVKALELLMAQLEQGKEPPQLLADLLRHLRNLLVVSSTRETASSDALRVRLVDEPSERLKRLGEQASQTTPEELLMCLQVLAGAYELVRRSPMAQTILELVVIKLCTREQWRSLEEISQRLERLTVPSSESRPISRSVPQPVVSSPVDPMPVQPQEALPASAPNAAAAVLHEVWPTFLEQLASQKMSLAAYLADSKPLSQDGPTLTIGLPGFSLHREVLDLAENRRLIERLLGELCQGRVTVQYTTLPATEEPSTAAPANPQAAAPPIVQDIVQLFNATVMKTPPRTT